jgi:toxin-antitoxin system PIN domain toxin
MKLIDLNVLLYAVNEDSVHHKPVKKWLEAAFSGDEPIALPWIVLLGFLRLTTNPRVFARPLSTEQALAHVERWLQQPPVRILAESSEQWRILRGLLEVSGTAGNLTTDAHLASLAIAHGAVLVSCDTDFGRFDKLQWQHPLRAS